MAEVKINSANKIAENSNLIWKLRPSPSDVPSFGVMAVSEWVSHLSEQLKCLDNNAQVEFDKESESIFRHSQKRAGLLSRLV